MRTALLLSFILSCAAGVFAQATQPQDPAKPGAPTTTSKPAPAPAPTTAQAPATSTPQTTAKPAPPAATTPQTTAKPAAPTTSKPAAPAATGRGSASSRNGFAITVMDMQGNTLPGILVELRGTAERRDTTNESGQTNFPSLPLGPYRFRFSGDAVTTLDKEVTLQAGKPQQIDVNLDPAPAPKEVVKLVQVEAPAPPAPEPAAPPGPVGSPQVTSVVTLLDKELERKQPRRESVLSCSGTTRTSLLQLNAEQPARLYESAESVFYVVAGEGTLRIGDKESKLEAGAFASVPRATNFVLARRGKNPFILLAILSGEPCEAAK